LAQNQKTTNYQENEQVPVAKVATSLGHPHFLHNKKHLALFPVTFISFKFGHNIQSDSNHSLSTKQRVHYVFSLYKIQINFKSNENEIGIICMDRNRVFILPNQQQIL